MWVVVFPLARPKEEEEEELDEVDFGRFFDSILGLVAAPATGDSAPAGVGAGTADRTAANGHKNPHHNLRSTKKVGGLG